MRDDRTIYDLSPEEYEEYDEHPEKYIAVRRNSEEDALKMMFPDGMDDD